MRDRGLERIAERAGLLTQWRDAFGAPQRVAPDTLRALLATMRANDGGQASLPALIVTDAATPSIPHLSSTTPTRARINLEQGGSVDCSLRRRGGRLVLDRSLPAGYHALEIGKTQTSLAAAPTRCFSVSDARGSDEKSWGIAAQIYALRREDDLGFGDFTALEDFGAAAARHGAAAVALSPLHAMFYADARRFSPYSPSNRAFLNVLHADPQKLVNDARQKSLRTPLIDWPTASEEHHRLSEAAFARFVAGELPGAGDFAEFRRNGGDALANHALFEALDEQGARKPAVDSTSARRFRDAHTERVAFHTFLQWRAARDLDGASAAARDMPIGFIADLAVGVDPNGSECWTQPHAMLIGATIGAPPDALNAIGQSWGLTTFSPTALRSDGFAAFLAILRAAMRHAGGVRLDHVMSLMRLWLVPDGARPVDGAYLRYPFDDLVRLVALESWRHRCIVIGEDLGTVPDDCRTRLENAGILGLDVLPFMRDGEKFIPPKRWRANAIAMTSTHDLAPVAGWWAGRDLSWRRRLHLFGERSEADERAERAQSRLQLAQAFSRNGDRVSARASNERIVDAAIDYVGASASPLAIVPLEDLLGANEAPNLPGTIEQHPNWRRRYSAPASKLLDAPRVARRLRRLARRGKST